MSRFARGLATVLASCVLLVGFLFLIGTSVQAQSSLNLSSPHTPLPQAPRLLSSRQQSAIRIVSSTHDSLVLEFVSPGARLMEERDESGLCERILTEGLLDPSEPGAPILPIQGALIGIPWDAAISLTVSDVQTRSIPVYHGLCTNPDHTDISAEHLDPFHPGSHDSGQSAYPLPHAKAARTPSPHTPASIRTLGALRSQRIAEVVFAPFSYNAATGLLIESSRIRVTVHFDASKRLETAAASSVEIIDEGDFENTLGLLLNYEDAKVWRSKVDIPQEPRVQAVSAAPQVYRVLLSESGLYRITYDDLVAASLPGSLPNYDPTTFRISGSGTDLAIQVLGEEDGSFDPGDEIRFYAQEVESKYTDLNTYWLSWGGEPGLRMGTVPGSVSGATTTPETFFTTRHFEQDASYRSSAASGPDNDHWYWKLYNSAGILSFDVPLDNPATGSLTSAISGLLKGRGADPYHHAHIYFNGRLIVDGTWPSQEAFTFTVSVPQSYLHVGSNTISVTGGTDTVINQFYVNWFDISYHATYTAVGDVLHFDLDESGAWQVRVSGFTTDTLTVVDITDLIAPLLVTDVQVLEDAGAFTVNFEQQTDGERSYLAVSESQLLSPQLLKQDLPSDIRSSENGADYIIIAHSDFVTAAQRLADHRSQQKLRTQVIGTQEIYDEFNHGIVDPGAIRDFLTYSYHHWQAPAPTYVVLLGDGNYDPTNNFGFGEISYVPPYLDEVDPWLGETAADNRYVAIVGDDWIPDMHLGRIPVKTEIEATQVISKIIEYETASLEGEWNGSALFIADDADDGGDFNVLSDLVADHHLPAPYTAQKLYYGVNIGDEINSAIRAAIDAGVLLVNYVGHGDRPIWASMPTLFRASDVAKLNNADRLPFIVPMTCGEGYYITPSNPSTDYSSLGETFVRRHRGGAIASWSPTGLGLATGHDYLNRALFDAIFREDIIELGPATTYAKLYLYANSGGQYLDLLDTYLLFGDPATRLNVLPVDLQISKEIVDDADVYTAGEPITYRLTFTNTGPATAHHVVISDTQLSLLRNPTVIASGAAITQQAGTAFIWDVADLPAGAGGSIAITGEIGPYAGPWVNTVAITTTSVESDPGNNRASTSTTVIAPDVSIVKSASPLTPLQPGDEVIYTLAFRNTGTAVAREVVIQDTLGDAYQYVSYVSAGVPVTVRPGSQYVWDAGDLAPGAAGTITIRATIDSAVSGVLTNTATLATSSVESDKSNNTAQAACEVLVPDLALSKHAAPGLFLHPGDSLTYTLVFTNVGSLEAEHVVLTDTLPSQLLNPTVTASLPITPHGGSRYTWNIGDVAPGTGSVITITGTLDSSFEGSVDNRATIGTQSAEYHLANNAGDVTVKVAWLFTDVRISQRVAPGPVLYSGDRVSYTLSYTNAGPATAGQVVISYPLPAQVRDPVVVSGGPDVVVRSGSHYIWDVADLGSGEGGTFVVTGVLDPTMIGYTLSHEVSISTSAVETTTLNNTTTLTVEVRPRALYLPIIRHGTLFP